MPLHQQAASQHRISDGADEESPSFGGEHEDSRALYERAAGLANAGRLDEALPVFEAARRRPGAPLEAIIGCARIRFEIGEHAQALALLLEAERTDPSRHEPSFWLGATLSTLGRNDEAVPHFRKAVALQPDSAESLNGLIVSLLATSRPFEAEPTARRLCTLVPSDATPLVHLSAILAQTNRAQEAVAVAERGATLAPNDIETLLQLGISLAHAGRSDEAFGVLMRAKRLAPTHALPGLRLTSALKLSGYIDDAITELHEVLRIAPDSVEAYCELGDLCKFTPGDASIENMEALLTRTESRDKTRRLHFALAKAYDSAGEPRRAFPHLEAGNALQRATFAYDETKVLGQIDHAVEVFPPPLIDRLSGGGANSSVPIFIVGMPRSGTTLVEQILASHPAVQAGGEADYLKPAIQATLRETNPMALDDLDRLTKRDTTAIGESYLARIGPLLGGKQRFTDKQLGNAMWVGMIHLALPTARIIHCVRDPADTCLSCYMQPFGALVDYAGELGTLGRYYRRHHALMDHWRRALPPTAMLEVRYEDVVSSTEAEARRILAYCGLDWDERCLSFHKLRRPVHTESAVQVRRPIYKTSIGRWRAYASFLGPLFEALGDLAPTVAMNRQK